MPNVIVVVPHNPNWAAAYEREATALIEIFGDALIDVHHIGSTSIPNIYAKPIIDVLVETSDLNAIDSKSPAMTARGYEAMGEFGLPGRRYFRRDDAQGVRTHHVHVFEKGSKSAVRHLAFRDYMIAHPESAQLYCALKRELAPRCGTDMEKYMDGKDPFIKETEVVALEWYHSRKVD
ncbi:MAG: GrpB family protein [Cyanobacteria bacterium SZAS-4]|nr:GrpB family protein [Cyanobacteria bacterium SZAS-4]